MKSNQWISIHLFYHDDPGPLLTDCIRPLISELRIRGTIERFFFIRYWQGGPHVRLRLLPADQTSQEVVQRLVEEQVGNFFTNHPSKTQIQEERYFQSREVFGRAEYNEEDQTPLYPNNSFKYIPYVPEYSRYQGVEAIPVVERHFMESSEIVLDLLQTKASRNLVSRQGLAMMFLGAWLYEDELSVLPEIFEGYYHWWSSIFSSDHSHYPAQFERQYARQRQTLFEILRRLLKLKQQHCYTSDDLLIARWIASMHKLKEQLHQLAQQGSLEPERFSKHLSHLSRADDHSLLSILFSCLHMHNNRLGLSMLEEGYLSFLLKQALTEMVADRSLQDREIA